ncbi:MAG: type I glutamate--ammonia ligase [Candidatus Bipolaricaulia bacterium]
MTIKELFALCGEQEIRVVDLKFADLPGSLHHFAMPIESFASDLFEAGLGFDGSSIRGFQGIEESDMLLIPDPGTAFVDPFYKELTLTLLCNVRDPLTLENYSRDPRYIAQKAEAYLKQMGIADVSYWGPEAEFFVFDEIRFDQNVYSGYYAIDSQEGAWNSGNGAINGVSNLGYKPRYGEGYSPVPPADSLHDLRTEAMRRMIDAGIPVEMHHHEVATAGQGEIDMRYDTLTRCADHLLIYKYILKNTAAKYGRLVTFMPKPLFEDNGSGMHTHQSLWKGDQNLFYDQDGYALLSETALYYIGGLLKHSPALLAFCAPTTNSYRRLVPGYEAPVNLAYSQRNRSACVRIPMYSSNPATKRIEYRPPDPSCSPYLAFAAMLMAGLDGIRNRIDPGTPLDVDIYELSPEEATGISMVPGSLSAVLDALEADHDFLLEGDVFTEDLIETWIAYKRENEVDPIRIRPHPYEFHLYHDV